MKKETSFTMPMLASALLLTLLIAGLPHQGSHIYAQIPNIPSSREAAFQRGRIVLLEHEVPFEPNRLREVGWQKNLAPVFETMPEMQKISRYGTTISGLLMGKNLYFPEKVVLTGDTVIVADKIMFEGHNVEITGNYALYIYPVSEQGVLGTTLETAVNEQSTDKSEAGKSFAERLLLFDPHSMQFGFTFKVDLSAPKGLVDTDRTMSGCGSEGSFGGIGAQGANGSPNPAPVGTPGTIGSPNGQRGVDGNPGDTGKNPEP